MRLNLCFALIVLCVGLIEAGPAPKIEEQKTLQETEKLEKTDLKIEESDGEKERAKKSTATFCVNLKPGSTDPNQISCKDQQTVPSVESSQANPRKARTLNGHQSSSSSSDEKNVESRPISQLSGVGGFAVPVSLPISKLQSEQPVPQQSAAINGAQPVLHPGLQIISQHGELRSALDDVDPSFGPILHGAYPSIPLQSPYYPYAIAPQPRMVLSELKHPHYMTVVQVPVPHHHQCGHHHDDGLEHSPCYHKPCGSISEPFAEPDSSAESFLRTHHTHHHEHIIAEKPSSCYHEPSVVYHCEPHTVLRDADTETETTPGPSPKTSNTIVNLHTPVLSHHVHSKPYIHGVDVGYPYVYRPHPHGYIPAGLTINAYHPHAHGIPFRSTNVPAGQLMPEFLHKRMKHFATTAADGSSSANTENSEVVAAKKE